MEQKNPKTLHNETEEAEVRDLNHTFLYAGVLVAALAMMIIASDPAILGLNIPVSKLLIVTLSAMLVSGAGVLALRRNFPVRPLSWGALVLYTFIITLTIHYTGGPLTPMPALYILVVVGASFLLERNGAIIIASLSALSYAVMLYYEYTHPTSMVYIWNMTFEPQERGPLLIINWLTVSIPTVSSALLAGTLAERLKRTNEQLRESERLRDNLTHMIIHDLRNPITAVMGGLDMLRMTLDNVMNDDQKRLLDNSKRSSNTLLNLVNDILDIHKMEAGKFNLTLDTTDLRVILEENALAYEVLTEIEGQHMHLEIPDSLPFVTCDIRLVSRVISNLLSNAIKHTPEDGHITLSTRVSDTEHIRVSVTDTGYGIAPEYMDNIFEKFSQAKGEERRGTGLGLTFCRMTMEAHNGKIWVESEVDKGSTFTLELPINGPAKSDNEK